MITSTGGISRWTGVAIFSYTFHRLVEKLDFEKTKMLITNPFLALFGCMVPLFWV
jgi:hypothetical protein